jgi:phenylacetate-CoA ligase
MTPAQLALYHRLPYPLRVLAATARGHTLRRTRYGPETDRLVAEALERESWSAERWDAWQRERLGHLLHRAATQVPYYRELWASRRRRGDRRPWDELANWPLLEKSAVRESPAAFLAEGCDPRRMITEQTSGSTGTPLELWWNRDMVRSWYALFEARLRVWNGVSRHTRWAILGGQVVAPVKSRRPPFWVWNQGLNQLYMSAFHLAPDLLPDYLDALRRYRIRYLLGYTSALYELARGVLAEKRDDLTMTVVLANAEPVFDYQRRAIEAAFRCPVRETYGMSEAVAAASECPAGRLHLWPEVGWVEVLGDEAGADDGSGELVTTGLLNLDMPLIRYRVGDRGRLAARGETCPCGRMLPRFASVEGRVSDILYMADGRAIGRLDPALKSHLPILEAQIIQETLDRILVKFVPAADYTPEGGAMIIAQLQARLGPVDIVLEPVDTIPRTSSGKFQSIICKLTPEQRARHGRAGTENISMRK